MRLLAEELSEAVAAYGAEVAAYVAVPNGDA